MMHKRIVWAGVLSLGLSLILSCGSDGSRRGGGAGEAGDAGAAGEGQAGSSGEGGSAGMPSGGEAGESEAGGAAGDTGAAGAAGAGGATEVGNVVPVEEPSGIRLTLDQLVYEADETVSVDLDFGDLEPEAETIDIAIACAGTGDAELVTLERDGDGHYVSEDALPLTDSETDGNDGELTVAAGEMFHAFYFVDRSDDALADLDVDTVIDFGLVNDTGGPEYLVEPDLALTDDETDPPEGQKPTGTLLDPGGLPVQIATEELIAYPRDDEELDRLLELVGGEITGEIPLDLGPDDEDAARGVLISVDLSLVDPFDLGVLRGLFGESSDLLATNEDVFSVLTLAYTAQAEGFLVSVNPRLQTQGAPAISAAEAGVLTHTMKMVGASGASEPCVPGDPSRPCVENVPALWAFSALWEADERRVNTAVLDMGFAPNDDFRTPMSGTLFECDMTAAPAVCAAGAAEGSPTVGASFFGDRLWHGTGVVTTIGGVVNNGWGAAGVAGLSAVPMLYKYDFQSYVFEIGAGIRRACDDGASVINISAGYPCRVLTNIGPAFDICSPEGRAGICAVVTAVAATAAATVCATLGPVPIVGPIACGVALGAVAAEVAACIAVVALGDVRGPMSSAVQYATRRGVPVVASAGNRIPREALPDVVRDLVNVSDARVESWGIVPASIPNVIAVGAVDSNLANTHFFGDRIDVWAPIESTFFSPESVDDPSSTPVGATIGGTSGAAPYITGVVASMQALNPDLDPATSSLTASQRAAIVGQVRGFLSDTAFSNGDLVALGYADDPVERRNLVNPLEAVMAASAAALPDLDGYDTSLNFSEALGTNDTAGTATPIGFGERLTGTILTLPVSGSEPTPTADVDWYTFTMPDLAGPVTATLALNYPAGHGALSLTGDHVVLIARGGGSDTDFTAYSVLTEPGADVDFVVQGSMGSDNVYTVELTDAELAEPTLRIAAPAQGAELCLPSIALSATASYPFFPDFEVPEDDVEWLEGGSVLTSGNPVNVVFGEGSHTILARAFGITSPSVTFDAITCMGSPPTVTITSPSGNVDEFFGGTDGMGYYLDVNVTGTGTDPEDGTLPGSALMWKTDRTDIQDELLGTGNSATLRIYGGEGCAPATTHVIRLEAKDSSDNPAVPDTFMVVIRNLC